MKDRLIEKLKRLLEESDILEQELKKHDSQSIKHRFVKIRYGINLQKIMFYVELLEDEFGVSPFSLLKENMVEVIKFHKEFSGDMLSIKDGTVDFSKIEAFIKEQDGNKEK